MSLRKSALVISLAAGLVSFLPQLQAQEQPVTEVPNARNIVVGEINAAGVNVRSGPADSYYPTMMLNKGDKVTVVGYRFDWLKILPPPGSFSYVAKIYVDRDGAAATGKINRDGVLVHAGSSINQLKTEKQTTLSHSASVEILGEADEYYKVRPPEGTYLYVKKNFVDVVGPAGAPAAAAAATPSTPAAGAPAAGTAAVAGAGAAAGATATGHDAFETVPAKPVKKDKVVKAPKAESATEEAKPVAADEVTNAEAEADFRKLEAQFVQSKNQPLDEQPVAEMLKGYTDLQSAAGLSSTTKRMVDFRVRYLTAASEQQAELVKAKQQAADFNAQQTEAGQQQKQIEQRIKETGVAAYQAIGQLEPSSIEKDGQPMLRLVDPADKHTLVYIRTADAKQRGMVGKFVGVRGEVAKDQQLSVDYIEPSEMEAVDPARVFKGVTARIYPPSAARGSEK